MVVTMPALAVFFAVVQPAFMNLNLVCRSIMLRDRCMRPDQSLTTDNYNTDKGRCP